MPNFIIVGAMRSGTTSLARYLGAHPGVFMAQEKELHYFDDNYDLGTTWYESHFIDAKPDQLRAEATPAYMSDPVAVERMAKTVPNALLVASFRDPIQRIWSHYWMRREQGDESRSFTEVLGRELTAYWRNGPDSDALTYLGNSLYSNSLDHLLGYYDADRLHIQIFERMRAAPESQFERLCAFLGIDETCRPENLGDPINAYIQFRSLAVREWVQRSPRGLLRRAVARLNTKRSVGYPELDESTRSALSEFFAPHNRALREMLGDPIPEWQA